MSWKVPSHRDPLQASMKYLLNSRFIKIFNWGPLIVSIAVSIDRTIQLSNLRRNKSISRRLNRMWALWAGQNKQSHGHFESLEESQYLFHGVSERANLKASKRVWVCVREREKKSKWVRRSWQRGLIRSWNFTTEKWTNTARRTKGIKAHHKSLFLHYR